jgi:hypothetical protein
MNSKVSRVFLLTIGCHLAGGAEAARSAPVKQYQLCVSRFVKVDLTDDAVDGILLRSSKILNDAAETSEACSNVSLKRMNSTSSWDDQLPRSVATSADFSKLVASPCVKVVQRITWCGGLGFSGGVLGCSPVPGNSMVVVRTYPGLDAATNSNIEPVTWLHEFGHTLGLPHNTTDAQDVMAPGISPTTTKLTTHECGVFAGSVSPAEIAAEAARPKEERSAASIPNVLPADGGSPPLAVNSETQPIEDFVKRPFGKPQVAEAAAYKDQAKRLEQMLFDPKFAEYKNNIVGILSVVGTPDTIPVLQDILKTPVNGGADGPDALAHFAALTAIGTIANRFKLDDNKVQILKAAQDPKFWEQVVQPAETWSTSKLDDGDVQSLTRDLSIQSVHSYALTGTKAALEYLKSLKKDAANAAMPEPARQERNEVLEQAIKLNDVSSKKGALSAFTN